MYRDESDQGDERAVSAPKCEGKRETVTSIEVKIKLSTGECLEMKMKRNGGVYMPLSSEQKNKTKPRVYKELLADPSGRVMKETSRHFFKMYFY